MGRLWRDAIRNYVGWIVFAVLFMAIMAATNAFSAYLMKPIVDDVFFAKNEAMLWPVGLMVITTFLVKGIANYGQSLLMNKVGLRIIADMQNKLFVHLSKMDLGFFHANPTGTLISRFTLDIQLMKVAVSNGITGFGKDMLTLVGLVGLMFYQDWQLATASFFAFPIAIYPIVRIGKRMRKVTANTQVELGLFTTVLNQTFQGIRVVKAYGMEAYEATRLAEVVERIFRLNMKAVRTREISRPIMETLAGAAVFVVIIYGGSRVIDGATTAGAFFSFLTALLMAYEPMKKLATLNASIQQGMAGAERLYDLLDQRPAIADKPDAKELTNVNGEIEFSSVGFAYDEDVQALRDISLHVPAGGTVALVGPSGAGKSTILNLIPRFYDIDSGAISVDGTDVRDATLESLFANIALVSQEITLFDDSVSANIAYGKAGAAQDEIEHAARHAAAHDFILELPNGYHTVVGEQGVKLSGGQRQRLAIARAMLKDAPILLLDEATSSLDTESERHIQAALDELMQGRTTLVIAHRLSTIMDADMIYVVDQGRIAEQGTHGELLARGGLYKKLYELQFTDEPTPALAPASEG
ncbi:MAG: lipid A export permease/ATP-binding protein MsbA [Rhodospirillaceae bacterium]|nr:lipid A export permease/ATP-binding protein MsbA [Rhodospirillaceae bacterium]